ncbi:hypothetical protein NM688_g6186 [Phlebia brevispora]|uniref:Uncharacterized protein n=1 Tax=Phlebia brevispora TaxID=194682 RepID=A0ACC1SJ00_9APHY|nr:hypothetical protein NM688_g6186 [Phlebia brevispora]
MAQLEEANKKTLEAQSLTSDAPSPSSHSTTTESFSFVLRIMSLKVESSDDAASPGTMHKTTVEAQD